MQISDTTREAWFKIQAENRIVWTSDQPPEQHPLEIIQRAIDAEVERMKADIEPILIAFASAADDQERNGCYRYSRILRGYRAKHKEE